MHERAEEVSRQRRNERHYAAGQVLFELPDSVIHERLRKFKTSVFILSKHQRAQRLQANNAASVSSVAHCTRK